jgi:hypothetical protein
MTKSPVYYFALALLICVMAYGCTKKANYSQADHTVGLTSKMRTWSGTSNGYYKGDTLIPPSTSTEDWAKLFNSTITDTSFAVLKVNGFAVSVPGMTMIYRDTDYVDKYVRFDSTVAGSGTSYLLYFYSVDSVYYEFHRFYGFNAAANQYYQTHLYLHTVHE